MSISNTVGAHAIPLADYPCVRTDATLGEAFATLRHSCDTAELFRSVLVLDSNDRLVGMLGLRDLLNALLPDFLRDAPGHYQGKESDLASLALLWQEDCAEHCRKAAAQPASAHLTPIKATLAEGDPLAKAVYLFATQSINVLPVTAAGRVTGVLRIVDVVDEVAREMLNAGSQS